MLFELEWSLSGSIQEIFNILARIEKKIDNLLGGSPSSETTVEVLQKLPLTNEENFVHFDSIIGKNKVLHDKLVSNLPTYI